jgi:hypothetical protein
MASKYDYSSTVVPIFLEKKESVLIAAPENYTQTLVNTSNEEFSWDISEYSHPLDLFNSEIVAEIHLQTSTTDATNLTVDSVLINNFFVGLFEQAKLSINGEEIEAVQKPFYSSTFMKYVSKSTDYALSTGQIEAWIPDGKIITAANTNVGRETRKELFGHTFRVSFKLSDIFGFCRNYQKPLYKIPFRITFQRRDIDASNKFVFHSLYVPTGANDAAKEINYKGHVFIKQIRLHMPINELNNEPQVNFLSQFNKNKEIDIIFNPSKTYTGSLTNTQGEENITIGKASQPPEMIVIGFTPSVTDHFGTNSGVFVHPDIKSIRINVGETQIYPSSKAMEMNSTSGYFEELYKNYMYASRLYGNDPQMSYLEFKKNPIFYFPTVKQERDSISSGATVSMTLDKTTTTVYRWYGVILQNTWYKTKLQTNGMTNFTKVQWNKK